MEGLLDLFECIKESPRHGEYLQEFLISCTEHQAFYKKKSNVVQPFVSFTNSKLNTPAERLEGLLLLKTFLPQCSDEQFLDSAISWMHQCVRGIESTKSLETNNAAFSVLKMLLEMASSFQELTKGIANSVIAKLADQLKLADKKPQVKLTAFQCVQTMIRNYGAPCTPLKTAVENFVLYEVDSKNAPLVSAASRCFAILPLVGGAGPHGANHKARWLEQQRRTCGTLRQLLDQLLDGVNEVETFGGGETLEILPLEPVSDLNPVVRVHEVANRFVNVAKFLEAMLLNEFPVAKSVLPDTIINVVCRGLSVNCATLGNKGSIDILTVGSVLPRIHVALLRVLKSLVLCLGKNLYPQAKLICRLILQTLKWTTSANRDYGTPRPYGVLRAEACRTLVAWLRVSKVGSCVEATADELVQALLQDVSTEKTPVKLNLQGGKKNKKRKHNATTEEPALTPQPAGVGMSARIKLTNPTANDKTCQAALDALYWLVHAAGVLVKPTLHKLLQETVLIVLFDIQRSARNDLPVPYSKVECRLSLYRLLQALTLDPHPMWPPPTQFALHVLARGQADPNCQVSGFCTVALCSVEKLIHSSSQALQFPISLEELLKGVNIEPAALPEPLPTEEPDRMSVSSRRSSSSCLTGPSCPSPDLAFTVPRENVISSSTQEDAQSDVSTVVYTGRDDPVMVQKQDPIPGDFSDPEDESSHRAKRVCIERETLEETEVPTETIDIAETDEPMKKPAGGKLFQGKFCNLTSPKLLGGGEVSKATRFDLKPRFVNLADDDEAEAVVNLSSDEEFHESNISVVSSNSNYQESILNKSGPNVDAEFEELEEGNEEGKGTENGNGNEESVAEVVEVLEVGGASVRSQDEDEGVLVIDLELTNGKAAAPGEGGAEWEEPKDKRNGGVEGENGGETDNVEAKSDAEIVTASSNTSTGNLETMSDAEVVSSLLDDFARKLEG